LEYLNAFPIVPNKIAALILLIFKNILRKLIG